MPRRVFLNYGASEKGVGIELAFVSAAASITVVVTSRALPGDVVIWARH